MRFLRLTRSVQTWTRLSMHCKNNRSFVGDDLGRALWRLTGALAVGAKSLVEVTCRNDGCVAYDVAEDPFDPGLVRFSELWPDHESLCLHLVAPHIEPWRAVARN